MKKYLMMGIAALALASCSKDDITYVNPDEAKYEMVFVNRFGTPNPNHTWGFGSSTRAFTRGFYADANEWAATDGGQYIVPDPLTAGQKARVQYYFQMNQYPGGTKDYGQIDFFVQQVYTGNTDPMAGKSPEIYKSVARVLDNGNSDLPGGINMDHLTAGSDAEHINNFNHGTRSTYPNVLDYTDEVQYAKNDNDQHHHPDEISLMLNTKTDKFGYANSDASIVRNDRYRQVSAEVIDEFCDNDANFATWLSNKGITDDKVNDKWAERGRSFIGFDFDMIVDTDCYDKNWQTGAINELTFWGEFYVNGVKQTNYVYQYNNKPVKMLSDQTNKYCGQTETLSDTELYTDLYDADNNNAYLGKQLNTAVIDDKLDHGFLPVANKQYREWVKVGGCADGYYSDWIVTFMPAKKYTTTIPDDDPYDYRVMAEDLSTNEKSDFDFNDVVFDVKYVSSTIAKVKVRAAGGVYPIRIAENDNYEVHALLGGGMTMLNTYAGHHNDLTAQVIEVSGSFGSSAEDAQFKAGVGAIKIEVSKDGSKTWTELTAPTGKAASKIGVPVDVDWCDEFQDIDEKWGAGAFAAWVGNETNKFWTSKTEWKQ